MNPFLKPTLLTLCYILTAHQGFTQNSTSIPPNNNNLSHDEIYDRLNNTHTYNNVLFLGMFNTQQDAEMYLRQNRINPTTLQKYDKVFAFGKDNKVYEMVRVLDDNLGGGTFTNYDQVDLQKLRIRNLTAHSNGNDVAVNLLLRNIIKVDNWLAESPPNGFESACTNTKVSHIDIRYTKDDKIAEWTGKGIIPGVDMLEKNGFELTSWLAGFKFTKRFGPSNNERQTITVKVYDDQNKYIIEEGNEHSQQNMDNNYIIEKLEERKNGDNKMTEEEYNKISKNFRPAINKFNKSQTENLGGVKIKIDPNKQTIIKDTSSDGKRVHDKVIKQKPTNDDISWPIK
jgi:hypothetical protein